MARPPLPVQGDDGPWGTALNAHIQVLGIEVDNKAEQGDLDSLESRVAILEGALLNATKSGGGGGVTDHGALSGLNDDDHPQYLTQSRGDALYAPIGEAGASP